MNSQLAALNNFLLPDAIRMWVQTQKIVVTGARGAIGRRLILKLLEVGAKDIIAYDLAPIQLEEIEHSLCPSVKHIQGDILDMDLLTDVFQGCNVLFHLAALVNVHDSIIEPIRYFHINSLGTAHVLEASRKAGVKNILYTSTCHVYGQPVQLPVNENHRTQPLSMYAATKLAGEATVEGYAASYGATCFITRLSNLFGASYTPVTAISLAINQALSGEMIALDNLQSIRDFIHVDDVLQAMIRLVALGNNQNLSGTQIVNVSTGKGTQLVKIAEILAETAVRFGFPKPNIKQIQENPIELIPQLIIDNSRLREMTGWGPSISLEDGIFTAASEFINGKNRMVSE